LSQKSELWLRIEGCEFFTAFFIWRYLVKPMMGFGPRMRFWGEKWSAQRKKMKNFKIFSTFFIFLIDFAAASNVEWDRKMF